jgi:pyruvate dehydrogenase E1 component alpha subunit
LTDSDNITVSFFGDGASEEGVVYETINFASLFKLPLLLVVENNLYSVMSKLTDRRSEQHNLEQIVVGFGAKYLKADGNDFFDVFEKTRQAIENIKTNKQPVVLECITFRHMAHSAPICDDKIGYRDVDTLESRQKNDSVKNLRSYLLNHYSEDHIASIEAEINDTVRSAIDFGVNSPYPPHEDLNKDVYHE